MLEQTDGSTTSNAGSTTLSSLSTNIPSACTFPSSICLSKLCLLHCKRFLIAFVLFCTDNGNGTRNLRVKHHTTSPTSVAKLDVRDQAISLAAMVLDEQIKSPYLAAKHFFNQEGSPVAANVEFKRRVAANGFAYHRAVACRYHCKHCREQAGSRWGWQLSVFVYYVWRVLSFIAARQSFVICVAKIVLQ